MQCQINTSRAGASRLRLLAPALVKYTVLVCALVGAGCSFDTSGVSLETPDAHPEAGADGRAESADAAQTQCAPPQTLCECTGDPSCDWVCTDLDSDPLHCGVCGEVCRQDEVCSKGECLQFSDEPSCDSCPCNKCDEDETCSTHPDDSNQIICVEPD